MLEKLGNALKSATDRIARAIFLDKKTIDAIVKDIQRALIGADVNIHTVKEITDNIRKQAENETIKGIEKKEHIIQLLHNSILKVLGGEKQELKLKEKQQTKILLAGLYGAGKTTCATKLALYYSKRGKKTAVIGLDVHRPAAQEQLKQNADKIKISCFIDKTQKNPIKIYKSFEKQLKEYDVLIIDTAGRHSLDKELVTEIKNLDKAINPDYKILVIQADIGQAAKQQAFEFQEALNINGVIITRMDSTAKAGGALTACYETKAPVFFIGTGEKPADLESFNPQTFISRLLGMGDLEGLLEKVQTAMDKDQQKAAKQRLESGEFDLRDFQQQLDSMQGIGSMGKIAELIPGFSSLKAKLPENKLDEQEVKMKKWKYIIDSMTKEEIKNPDIIEKQTTRLGRIAKGAGCTTTDIRQLLKQYKMIKELTDSSSELGEIDPGNMQSLMSNKKLMKLAKKFGKSKKLRF